MAVNSPDKSLATSPLNQVVPRVAALVAKMTIDDVAALLSGHASGRASTANARTLDEIARAILDLPSGGHRLRDVERTVVAHALVQTKGNVSAAARLLGTDRKSLERRIERHKLAVPRGASR